jgi:hypothetical protein
MICPICKENARKINSIRLLNLIDSSTYQCNYCSVYFRSPLPNEEDILKYYTSRYFRYPDKIEQEMAKIQGLFLINHLMMDFKNFREIKYLEFGAGRGWLIEFLKNSGLIKSAIGIEPDIISVEWGRNNLNVDLRNGCLDENSFTKMIHEFPEYNLISLVHVFEHLRNPINILDSMRKSMYPHYLFLEVPDGEYEGRILEIDTFPWSSMCQHFWSFSEKSLRILLNEKGYEIITLMHEGQPKYWDNHFENLSLWIEYFNIVNSRYNEGKLLLKDLFLTDLNFFYRNILLKMKIIFSRKYSRLDLPIIRLLAKTKE